MKTIKVNHVVLTLKISLSGNGETQAEIDDKINRRLAEGYDEVESHIVRTNFGQDQAATDIVILYVFRAYEKDAPSEVVTVVPKSKKSKAEGD